MQQEKKLPTLPADDAVQNWFEENIDKDCSASSAIYKFRLWLESLQREYQVKRQQAIGLGLIEDNLHPAGCEWVKAVWGMIPDGIHSMKLISSDNVVMRGTGLVTDNAITLITFLNKTTMGINELPKDYEGVYWLNESPSEPEQKEAVAFAEWCANNYRREFEPYSEEYKWMKGDIYYSTEQLYEQYLQQKG